MYRPVLPHLVTPTADVDRMVEMHDANQHRRHHVVAEYRDQLLEPLVWGRDRRSPIVMDTDRRPRGVSFAAVEAG